MVVVTYNSAALLPDLLGSVRDALRGRTWRLLVADNDSADGSAGLVRTYEPTATVIEMGRNAGYSAGINAALATAGDYRAALILNPDVRLSAHAVDALETALAEPGVGIAVPQVVDDTGRPVFCLRRDPTLLRCLGAAVLGAERAGRWAPLGEVVVAPAQYAVKRPVDWAVGAVLLVARDCAEAVGAWDERYFLYSEETDFMARARDRGFAVLFEPAASVVHVGGESRVSPDLRALLVVNKVRYFARRHGVLPTAAFWLVTLLGETLRAARGDAVARAAARGLVTPPGRRRGALGRIPRTRGRPDASRPTGA